MLWNPESAAAEVKAGHREGLNSRDFDGLREREREREREHAFTPARHHPVHCTESTSAECQRG